MAGEHDERDREQGGGGGKLERRIRKLAEEFERFKTESSGNKAVAQAIRVGCADIAAAMREQTKVIDDSKKAQEAVDKATKSIDENNKELIGAGKSTQEG